MVLFPSVAHLPESSVSLLWSETESWSESSVPQLGSCQRQRHVKTRPTTPSHGACVCTAQIKHDEGVHKNRTTLWIKHLAVIFHSAAGQEHDKEREVCEEQNEHPNMALCRASCWWWSYDINQPTFTLMNSRQRCLATSGCKAYEEITNLSISNGGKTHYLMRYTGRQSE